MRLIDRFHHPLISNRGAPGPAGAVLIALIIAIVLIAAMGAAIYTLSTGGSYGTLSGGLSMRAFYAAESGYRYAASESGNIANLESVLTKPNPFTLPDGLGWFSIDSHPYFFITSADAGQGEIALFTILPSTFPQGFSVPAIRLALWSKQGKKLFCNATSATLTQPQRVDFQLSSGLPEAVNKDTIVCPVATISGNQHLVQGGSLLVQADSGSFFPNQQGQIEIGDSSLVYSYTQKQEDSPPGQTTLTNIQGVSSASRSKLQLGVDVSDGSDITLKPFIEMAVTGTTADPTTLAEEAGPYVGKKEINYFIPVNIPEPLLSDSFENLNHWAAPAGTLDANVRVNQTLSYNWGVHQGGALLGGSGYDPAPESDPDTSGKQLQSIFMIFNMIPELEDAWSRGGHYLSYDVQVKHAWEYSLAYAADGISVRWHDPDGSGRYQGLCVSFMRYSGIGPGFNDDIPDTIKPPGQDGIPLLVLWEQRVAGTAVTRRWIAYKDLTPDTYVRGNQWAYDGQVFDDLSSLFVRVQESNINGDKTNTLKVFYGDASTLPARIAVPGNDIADDLIRWVYPPSWSSGSPGMAWPDDTAEDWRQEDDYMTWVTWDEINPGASEYHLSTDRMSIETTDFVTPDDDFSGRSEIALHAFGDLTKIMLFDDFGIRIVQNGLGNAIQQ